MFKDLTVRLVLVYEMPQTAKDFAAKDITNLLEKGQLIHRVAHTLPLNQIAEGHKLIEQIFEKSLLIRIKHRNNKESYWNYLCK